MDTSTIEKTVNMMSVEENIFNVRSEKSRIESFIYVLFGTG